ncbi:unnamed protein product [Lactuca virosa]|uniref:Uncharacterized protein n=1 Tax=Lactuca virosa TaxID=75947 RepID=A0AAU9M9X1_9ASTR|nr:unnamed protein product [Lactuca virosa]
MEGAGSWSAVSLPSEENAVHGASDPIDKPALTVASEEDPMEDSDDTVPDYTPAEHPSEPDYTLTDHSSPEPSEPIHSPDYTPVGLELLSSEYKPNEDEEDSATSPEISPPLPTP